MTALAQKPIEVIDSFAWPTSEMYSGEKYLLSIPDLPFYVCNECDAESDDPVPFDDQHPITHLDEMDSFPSCDVCGAVFTYVSLTHFGQEMYLWWLEEEGDEFHDQEYVEHIKQRLRDYGYQLEPEYPDLEFYREPFGTNVIAVSKELVTPSGNYEAIGAVFSHDNSPCAGTAVSPEYLEKCTRITEAEARINHPELFVRLEAK